MRQQRAKVMSAINEAQKSQSSYVEMIWRGQVLQDYAPVCPADTNWNLLFIRHQGKVRVTAEGATTRFVPKTQFEGVEFLVIKFRLGVYMPYILPGALVNRDALLPNASSTTFWLNGSSWQVPDFENVETFIEWLVRKEIVVREPMIDAVLRDQEPMVSTRTIRRRFLHTTGLTPKQIQQIKRAHRAVDLLRQGVSPLDIVYQLGYADQAHMTRSVRRFYGYTPSEIIRDTGAV